MYRFSLGGDIITDNKEDVIKALQEIVDKIKSHIERDWVPCGLWGQEWILDADYEYPDDDEIEDPEDY